MIGGPSDPGADVDRGGSVSAARGLASVSVGYVAGFGGAYVIDACGPFEPGVVLAAVAGVLFVAGSPRK